MTTKAIAKSIKAVAKKSKLKSNQGHDNQTHHEARDSREADRQGIETCWQEAKPDRGRDPDPRQVKEPDELYGDGRSHAVPRLVEYAKWSDA